MTETFEPIQMVPQDTVLAIAVIAVTLGVLVGFIGAVIFFLVAADD